MLVTTVEGYMLIGILSWNVMPIVNKMVLLEGWPLRHLGALHLPRVFLHPCRYCVEGWRDPGGWVRLFMRGGGSPDNTPLWPRDLLSTGSGWLDLINSAGQAKLLDRENHNLSSTRTSFEIHKVQS